MKKIIALLISALLISCCSATTMAAVDFFPESESVAGSARAMDMMYDYDYDSIPGVKLTNATYDFDTYACAIARAEVISPSAYTETTLELQSRIMCDHENGLSTTNTEIGEETELVYGSPLYVNSGDAEYKTTTRVTTLHSSAYFVCDSGNYSMYAPYYEGEDFFVP